MNRMVMPAAVLMVLCGAYASWADPHAGGYFVPPTADKAGVESSAFTADELRLLLDNIDAVQILEGGEEPADQLRQAAERKPGEPLQGAVVLPVEMSGENVLGTPVAFKDKQAYLGSIVSPGAEAVRLQVDLSGLGNGDEAWIIAPSGPRAYGPYTREEGTRWLSTAMGEESVLVVLTARQTPPQVRLMAVSHVFLTMEEIAKELGCNLDLACETDEEVLDTSTAVAIIMVAGSWFCSGTLLNNEKTSELEPFFLTANHCICCKEDAHDTEVYWDFRSSACGANDAPKLEQLPRSRGTAMLATDDPLDATLIRLNAVPAGLYGRLYAGWDAAAPHVGDAIYVIHHPQALYMRISKGTIIDDEDNEGTHIDQIKVHYDEGVTEAGSSGSALFYANSHCVAGALSQGPMHTCGPIRTGNVDWFASLHEFYPMVQMYIDSAMPSAAEDEDDCKDHSVVTCPFQQTWGTEARVTQKFRAFRDNVIKPAPGGEALVEYWYSIAPTVAQIVDASPQARAAFKAVTAAAAEILGD